MTATTISGLYTTAVTLSNPTYNPAYVTGTISVNSGVALMGAVGTAWTITNAGRIGSQATGGNGIVIESGGTVMNLAGGLISGGRAIAVYDGLGIVANQGDISGVSQGVYLHLGQITNQAGGTISASNGNAVEVGAHPAGVLNLGSIAASGDGVLLRSGGLLTNAPGGEISGGVVGVSGYGTVVNAGGITGGTDAVLLASGHANRLVMVPGAAFGGTVDGGNIVGGASGSSTIELTSAASAGTLAGIGYKYINFAQVLVDAGARWTFASGTLIGQVSDFGTLTNNASLPAMILPAGAVLTNAAGGQINGVSNSASGAASVVNAGYIYGVRLLGPNAVTNQGGGTIHGDVDLLLTNGAASLRNAGTIISANIGVYINGGGSVTNQAGGVVTGGLGIEFALGAPGTVLNAGNIAGTFASHYGIYMQGGGTVTNQASGTISDRVFISYGSGAVINAGSINGAGVYAGVDLEAGGGLTNQAGGLISGYNGVVLKGLKGREALYGTFASASVLNLGGGTIVGQRDGIDLGQAAPSTLVNAGRIVGNSGDGIAGASALTITNQSGGVISGGTVGVLLAASSTLVAAGTISGAYDAVVFGPGQGNLLAVDPGASFSGTVDGGNTIGATAISTLELASAAGAGTLSGLGTQFIDFARTTIDAGARWTLTGSNSIGPGGTLSNAGTLDLTNAILTGGAALENNAAIVLDQGTLIAARIMGTGSVTIGTGGTLEAQGTIASGETIEFAGGGAYLRLDNPDSVAGSVANFDAGETIDLRGVDPASVSRSLGMLQFSGGAFPLAIANGVTLQAVSDGASGAMVTLGTSTGGITLTQGATISGAVSTGITLSNPAYNPVYITGTISVASAAALTGDTGTVWTIFNAGLVAATGNSSTGIVLDGAGVVTNQASGTISGAGVGVHLTGGTLVNAGRISGASAVSFSAGYAAALVVDPGASFAGTVDGGNTIGATAISTLELASAASAGTLSGLGTQFLDFAQTTIDAGARWTLAGSNTIASAATLTQLAGSALTITDTLKNDGVIMLDPSTLIAAGLVGTGSVTIGAGSTLETQGTISSGETIEFTGSGGYLRLDNPGSVAGSVTNFDAGETIDLRGVDPASVTYSDGQLHFNGGAFPLALAGSVTPQATGDGANGALVALCLRAGTRIATEHGDAPVEQLAVGDRVQVVLGRGCAPVVWIGHRRVDCRRHPRPSAVWPVRIAAGAFGPGRPRRELYLSPDHAIHMLGVLIPVKHLVNGATIAQVELDEVTYYHVELPRHDVLLAEGLAVESYIDTGGRANFANGGQPVRWFADFSTRTWEAFGCAPLIVTGPRLDEARRLVNAMADAVPRPRAGPSPAGGHARVAVRR